VWLVQNTFVAQCWPESWRSLADSPSPAAVRHALWLVVLIKADRPAIVYWPWTAESLWQPIGHWFMADEIQQCKRHSEAADGGGSSDPLLKSTSDAPIEVFSDSGRRLNKNRWSRSWSRPRPRKS